MYNNNYMKGSLYMNQTSEMILSILSFILILVILWFSYTIINIIVTILRCKKRDHSLTFCFNTIGKVVYILLTILYVVGFIGSIVCIVYGLIYGKIGFYRNGINVLAFVSVVFGYLMSSIVLVGKKNMMVGRMEIDYRKLKKVNYSYTNKMSFVYSQHEYNFSTRFVDLSELRKRISK